MVIVKPVLKPNVQRRTAASLLHLIAAKQIPHYQKGPFSGGDPLNLFEFISIRRLEFVVLAKVLDTL